MDFHSLTRKELQTLCKKNKIPANLTNLAMADALQALQLVEGLDELLNPSECALQTPAKAVIESSDNAHTARRTSARARRPARSLAQEDADQENKDANVTQTPALQRSRRRAPAASACRKMETHLGEAEENKEIGGQDKSEVPETPAVVPRSRRRAPGASTSKKTETQKKELSVQQVYCTRRSVRILEKSMAGLNLKEKEKIEPLEMLDLSKEVEEQKDMPGSEVYTIQEESSEKFVDSEVLSSHNSNEVLEDEIEMQDAQANKKINDVEVDNCDAKPEVECRKPDILDAPLVSVNNDEAQDENEMDDNESSEKSADSEVLSGHNSNELPEEKIEMQDAQANKKINDAEVDNCDAKPEVECGKPDILDAPLVSVDNDEAQDENEMGEDLNKTITMNEKGPVDVPVTEFSFGTENSIGLLKTEDKIAADITSEDVDHAVVAPSLLPRVINNSEIVEESVVFNSLALSSSDDGDKNMEAESANLVDKDSAMNVAKDDDDHGDAIQVKSGAETGFDSDKVLEDPCESQESMSEEDVDDAEADQRDSESDTTLIPEDQVACTELLRSNKEVEDSAVTKSYATDASFGDSEVELPEYPDQSEEDSEVTEAFATDGSRTETDSDWGSDSEVLVDVQVTEMDDIMTKLECQPQEEEGSEKQVGSDLEMDEKIPLSKGMAPCHAEDLLLKKEEDGHCDTVVDVHVMSEAEFTISQEQLDKTPTSTKPMSPPHRFLPSGGRVGETSFSPLAGEHALPSQFPRPQLTPNKSSAKKQTTTQKLTPLSNKNKENINIDHNGGSSTVLELKQEKVKKVKKNKTEYESKSLRGLRMELKKFKIKDTKKQQQEEEGKARTALQALPKNCMVEGEARKEN